MRHLLASLASFSLLISPLAAQEAKLPPNCAPRTELTKRLIAEDRSPVLVAPTADNKILEIWQLPDNGEWLLIVTLPDGVSCVANTGPRAAVRQYTCVNPKTCI
jgi:hypothetical protein